MPDRTHLAYDLFIELRSVRLDEQMKTMKHA